MPRTLSTEDDPRQQRRTWVVSCSAMASTSYALIVAEARSCLAALADTAPTFDQSVAYDRLLLRLDGLRCDDGPACEPMPGIGRDELQRRVEAAIGQLVNAGIDALSVELLLADLHDSSTLG